MATFCNGDVFDINPEGDNHQPNQRLTSVQPSLNQWKTTKKNDKKGNNEKNEENVCSASGDASNANSSSKSYCGLSGVSLDQFNQFMDTFAYKRNKKRAAEAWKGMGAISDELFQKILAGASRYAKSRRGLKEKGLTPKMPDGWLADQRWEDELSTPPQVPKKRIYRHPALLE